MFENKLLAVEQQMMAQLNEIRATFQHSGDKGANVEDIFREFIREYLPRRYAVGHGEVIDSNSNRSGQTDIVIVNEDHPFIFTENAPGLFLVEGVAGAGEVKSILDSNHLTKSIAASERFKKLRAKIGQGTTISTNPSDRDRYYQCPPYFLVAMESSIALQTIVKTINEVGMSEFDAPYKLLDAVFVLGRGWAINFGDGKGSLSVTHEGKMLTGWLWKTTDSVLFMMLAWLSSVIPRMVRYRPIIAPYLLPINL